jgi:hypothetical protein
MASQAPASVISTFSYNDLDGSYSSGSGTFTAAATDVGLLRTSGEVSRLVSSTGNAVFEPGFSSGASMADFTMTINVTNVTMAGADGMGSITATDADGDTLTADLSGEWVNGGSGIAFFNGLLSNVVFSDPDGTFDGSAFGSISTDFAPAMQPYDGAIVSLFIATGGGFFSSDFRRVATDVDGQILPAPGAMAIASVGGLMLVRRRRR